MKTITTNIYQFNELNETAKEKVLNNLYSINVEDYWWEYTYEDAKEIGLIISSFNIDRGNYITATLNISMCESCQEIINNHGECTDTYKLAIDTMNEWQPIFNEYMDENSVHYESYDYEQKMIEIEEEYTKNLSECYLSMLKNEYEYLTSEKCIIETIEANDYYFTECGKLSN
jgi:hypothetical protein